eukprot:352672-Chlamydomonas_euryale.AAC.12
MATCQLDRDRCAGDQSRYRARLRGRGSEGPWQPRQPPPPLPRRASHTRRCAMPPHLHAERFVLHGLLFDIRLLRFRCHGCCR